MYYLVINGDPEDAVKAAKKYGVIISGPIYNQEVGDTNATADDSQTSKLKEWWFGSMFSEAGALLYYGRR